MCASFAVRPRRVQSPHTSQGAVRSILHGSARFKVQCSPSLRPPSYGVPYMPLRYRRPRRFAALCDRPECSRLAPFSHRGPRTWLSLSSSLTGGSGVRSPVGPAFGHRRHGAHRGLYEIIGAFMELRTHARRALKSCPATAAGGRGRVGARAVVVG